MPCRKENYILLEQSVTVDSKEVDALVTKLGEVLQLHNNSAAAGLQSMSCLHGLSGRPSGSSGRPSGSSGSTAPSLQSRAACCMRLRKRGAQRGSRASPYRIPGSGDTDWDRFKPWSRKRGAVDEDDPHQLLQELILSGNLIKEAVRRLQFSAPDCGDHR